jgi:hypothetical protein
MKAEWTGQRRPTAVLTTISWRKAQRARPARATNERETTDELVAGMEATPAWLLTYRFDPGSDESHVVITPV